MTSEQKLIAIAQNIFSQIPPEQAELKKALIEQLVPLSLQSKVLEAREYSLTGHEFNELLEIEKDISEEYVDFIKILKALIPPAPSEENPTEPDNGSPSTSAHDENSYNVKENTSHDLVILNAIVQFKISILKNNTEDQTSFNKKIQTLTEYFQEIFKLYGQLETNGKNSNSFKDFQIIIDNYLAKLKELFCDKEKNKVLMNSVTAKTDNHKEIVERFKNLENFSKNIFKAYEEVFFLLENNQSLLDEHSSRFIELLDMLDDVKYLWSQLVKPFIDNYYYNEGKEKEKNNDFNGALEDYKKSSNTDAIYKRFCITIDNKNSNNPSMAYHLYSLYLLRSLEKDTPLARLENKEEILTRIQEAHLMNLASFIVPQDSLDKDVNDVIKEIEHIYLQIQQYPTYLLCNHITETYFNCLKILEKMLSNPKINTEKLNRLYKIGTSLIKEASLWNYRTYDCAQREFDDDAKEKQNCKERANALATLERKLNSLRIEASSEKDQNITQSIIAQYCEAILSNNYDALNDLYANFPEEYAELQNRLKRPITSKMSLVRVTLSKDANSNNNLRLNFKPPAEIRPTQNAIGEIIYKDEFYLPLAANQILLLTGYCKAISYSIHQREKALNRLKTADLVDKELENVSIAILFSDQLANNLKYAQKNLQSNGSVINDHINKLSKLSVKYTYLKHMLLIQKSYLTLNSSEGKKALKQNTTQEIDNALNTLSKNVTTPEEIKGTLNSDNHSFTPIQWELMLKKAYKDLKDNLYFLKALSQAMILFEKNSLSKSNELKALIKNHAKNQEKYLENTRELKKIASRVIEHDSTKKFSLVSYNLNLLFEKISEMEFEWMALEEIFHKKNTQPTPWTGSSIRQNTGNFTRNIFTQRMTRANNTEGESSSSQDQNGAKNLRLSSLHYSILLTNQIIVEKGNTIDISESNNNLTKFFSLLEKILRNPSSVLDKLNSLSQNPEARFNKEKSTLERGLKNSRGNNKKEIEKLQRYLICLELITYSLLHDKKIQKLLNNDMERVHYKENPWSTYEKEYTLDTIQKMFIEFGLHLVFKTIFETGNPMEIQPVFPFSATDNQDNSKKKDSKKKLTSFGLGGIFTKNTQIKRKKETSPDRRDSVENAKKHSPETKTLTPPPGILLPSPNDPEHKPSSSSGSWLGERRSRADSRGEQPVVQLASGRGTANGQTLLIPSTEVGNTDELQPLALDDSTGHSEQSNAQRALPPVPARNASQAKPARPPRPPRKGGDPRLLAAPQDSGSKAKKPELSLADKSQQANVPPEIRPWASPSRGRR